MFRMDNDPGKAARLLSAGKLSMFVGAGLVFVSQTSPEVAKSNVSAWLQFIGIDRVPHVLASTSADTWLLAFAICEIIGGLVFFLWARGLKLEMEEKRRLRRRGVHVDDEFPVGGLLGIYLKWLLKRRTR